MRSSFHRHFANESLLALLKRNSENMKNLLTFSKQMNVSENWLCSHLLRWQQTFITHSRGTAGDELGALLGAQTVDTHLITLFRLSLSPQNHPSLLNFHNFKYNFVQIQFYSKKYNRLRMTLQPLFGKLKQNKTDCQRILNISKHVKPARRKVVFRERYGTLTSSRDGVLVASSNRKGFCNIDGAKLWRTWKMNEQQDPGLPWRSSG